MGITCSAAYDRGLSPGCTLLLKEGNGGANRGGSGDAGVVNELGPSPCSILLSEGGDCDTKGDSSGSAKTVASSGDD